MSKNPKELLAVAVKLPSGKQLFSFPVEGKEIFDIATVHRVRRDKEKKLAGFQRKEYKKHISEITKYIETDDSMIPNAIVIAFNETVTFKELPEFSQGPVSVGYLKIPLSKNDDEKAGFIIDGQQRTYAIERAKVESFPMMVCAFLESDEELQTEHFVNVNQHKNLPRELINELLPHMRNVPTRLSKQRAAAKIANHLAWDADSPMLGIVKSETQPVGVLQLNSLVAPLKAMFSEPTNFVGSKVDPDQQVGDIEEVLVGLKDYWTAVKEVFPDAWGKKPTESRLMHGQGVWAMMQLLTPVYLDVRSDPTVERMVDRLRLLKPYCHWTKEDGDWENIDGFEHDVAWNGMQNTVQDKRLLTMYLTRKYLEATSDEGQ